MKWKLIIRYLEDTAKATKVLEGVNFKTTLIGGEVLSITSFDDEERTIEEFGIPLSGFISWDMVRVDG